ncbi:serine/arginine repetitive matrix protein 1-like [Seriola lalandi dorsalis]|uniref:serine/arginine repetitive matrix protein 1-like n=1 Tax=Seriola lalandi dorsalis TaxID=1841481 RepID=UPI000C6FAC9D|nr:serine/arginine repetitive matrix protein 1-like [Seriola lalandi dorsalis]
MEEYLTCSICMETFEDPVTTDCGHSFCKKCLNHCHEYTDLCPMCKKPLSRIPDVNIVLRDIVQRQKVEKIKEEDDDIYTGEDIYTDQTLKAMKSCLVCLASYCSTHLENHSSTERLKGHKLVAPVKNLDEDSEEVVTTEDEQGKKSLQVCQVCGWSKMTTYRGLRIHQGKKGCIPKGMKIQKTEQGNWQKLGEMEPKVDQRRRQPAKRLTFNEEHLPKPPSRNVRPNSAAAAATINNGNNSAFATSERSSLRTARSNPGHLQQYFLTLPQIFQASAALPIPPPPVVRLKERRVNPALSQSADRRATTGSQRAAAATIKDEPISSFAVPQPPFRRTPRSKPGHQQQYFPTPPQRSTAPPVAPPPAVRPKEKRINPTLSQTADGRAMKENQRATAATIKEEPKSPVAIPPRPFQRPTYPPSANQLPDFYTGVQVNGFAEERPSTPPSATVMQLTEKDRNDNARQERLKLELQQKIQMRREKMSNMTPAERACENIPDSPRTSRQTNTAAAAAADTTTKQDPSVEGTPFSSAPPVTAAKPLARRFSATTAQGTTVQPKEKDREDEKLPQHVPDSTSTDQANTTAATAEATIKEDPASYCETAEPDFSTGMKVKDLAQMFSATTAQETADQPKEKHRETISQEKPVALRFPATTAQQATVQPKERDKEDQKRSQNVPDSTSTDQTNTAAAAAAEATTKDESTSLGEPAQPDFSTGMKVKELARMFSATTTQETAGRPREKQTLPQAKLQARRFPAATAQQTTVQQEEKDREDQKLSQKVPGLTGATTKMNPTAAEATTREDPKSSCEPAQLSDFSTGMKVKELARMFSATTTQKSTVRPNGKH